MSDEHSTAVRAIDLVEMRKSWGWSQADMGQALDMSPRQYSLIETGKSTLKRIHVLAIERLALAEAVKRRNPMLAPASVRLEALKLAGLLTGQS